MINYLTLEEILRLHFQVIEDYGGSHGVRDEERLKSVVLAPQQEVFGREQYPDVFEKVAVYMRNIIGDHAFADGNKRSGVTVAGVFLLRNGIAQTATPKELEDFAVQVAVEHLDVPTIAVWLRAHGKAA
ncbi:MAG TPA: type II toxin-antitoxin system death-on-curing family toxin [Candidatus Saccharimonadales bacterium]